MRLLYKIGIVIKADTAKTLAKRKAVCYTNFAVGAGFPVVSGGAFSLTQGLSSDILSPASGI